MAQSIDYRIGDAFANVAKAIEASRERQQVEYVFGLTGGELEDKPLKFTAPNTFVTERSWLYHYEGAPEWAIEDFEDYYNNSYLTLVETDCCYGSSAPDTIMFQADDDTTEVLSK